jgi:hypothetical protein
MTSYEFIAECGKRLIYAPTALENEKILAALKAKDDELVKTLLDTEF